MGNLLRVPALAAAVAFALPIGGCGSRSATTAGPQPASAQTPTQLADTITRAIYDNKPDVARQTFDDALKSQIQDYQVLFLSQAMHRLGDYDGVKVARVDADHARYVYRAFFTRGKMEIRIRLRGDGKVSAYRAVPEPLGMR
jgi:hypothetical protein